MNQPSNKQPIESPTHEKKHEVQPKSDDDRDKDEGVGAKGSKKPPEGDQEGQKWPGGGPKGEDESR